MPEEKDADNARFYWDQFTYTAIGFVFGICVALEEWWWTVWPVVIIAAFRGLAELGEYMGKRDREKS